MKAQELLTNPEPTVPAPTPLPETLPKVIAFKPEMLPACISDYILDVSDRQQSPPDFMAVVAVCGLSAILGRKVLIRPKQNDDWTVVPNQWGMIIGRPSAMKSPSMKEALKPLQQIESDAAEQYVVDSMRYKAESALAEIEQKEAKQKAVMLSKNGDREGALKMLSQAEFNSPPPTRLRLVLNDTTVEKLGELLNENPNGLILVRDELVGLLAKLGREEYQSDRAFYLECFDGNGSFIYDRIGRGTIEIDNCTLSLIGGIQPSKLSPLVQNTINGSADDGLIQRMQLAVWPDDLREWDWKDRAPNTEARARYHKAFTDIHSLQLDDEHGEPTCLRFTQGAQDHFIEWMEAIQADARAEEIPPILESYLLKMPQTVAGLALLFELVDGGRDAVGISAIARALEWADYLRSHAERIYSIVTNGAVSAAKVILKLRNKLPPTFTSRDVYRKKWSELSNSDVVKEALECLVDYHHLIAIESPPSASGGRPKISYMWNPELKREKV